MTEPEWGTGTARGGDRQGRRAMLICWWLQKWPPGDWKSATFTGVEQLFVATPFLHWEPSKTLYPSVHPSHKLTQQQRLRPNCLKSPIKWADQACHPRGSLWRSPRPLSFAVSRMSLCLTLRSAFVFCVPRSEPDDLGIWGWVSLSTRGSGGLQLRTSLSLLTHTTRLQSEIFSDDGQSFNFIIVLLWIFWSTITNYHLVLNNPSLQECK